MFLKINNITGKEKVVFMGNSITVGRKNLHPIFLNNGNEYPCCQGMEPKKIKKFNSLLRDYAAEHGFPYVDYYSAMVDENGGLKSSLIDDGLHPTRTGTRSW